MPILVATGGAAHSTVALTFGAHLAKVTGRRLTVLTVIKREEQRAKAEAILESAAFILAPLCEQYESKIRVGHPAEEIIAESEDSRYSMVVVGEKQHHGLLTRFVLGATALRVVEHAPCPVVLVKGQVHEVRHVLLCDSGAPQGSVVGRAIEQLPRLLNGASTLTVLHVMSQMSAGPGVDGQELRADVDELIREHSIEGEIVSKAVHVLHEADIQSEPLVRHGRVVDEILAEAKQGNYDLVIVGAHQGHGWRRILLDDIAHQIVVGLDRPVLVVR